MGTTGTSQIPTTTPPTTPGQTGGGGGGGDIGEAPTMDWEEAYGQASDFLNPYYDTLRGRTERSFSDQREYAPQMIAAKYGGVSALRGGRAESQRAQLTQKEAQAINELENARNQAINQRAKEIQDNYNTTESNKWLQQQQLKQQQQEFAARQQQNQALLNLQRENKWLKNWLKQLGYDLDAELKPESGPGDGY